MAGQEPEGNDSPEVWRYDAPTPAPQPPAPPTAPAIPTVGAGSGGSTTSGRRLSIAIGVAVALVAAAGTFVLLRDDDRSVDPTDASNTTDVTGATGTQITETQITETGAAGDPSGASAATLATDPPGPAMTDGPSDSSRVDRTPEVGVTTTSAPATTVAPTTITLPPVPPSTLPPLPTQPPPVTPSAPRIAAAAASSTRPNATDGCDPPNPTTYSANQLFDGIDDTAWMTVGAGVDANIVFTLQSAATVSYVGLIAGYNKVDPCRGFDRFHDLRRIVRVRWSFDDGRSVEQTLDPEDRTVQYLPLAPFVTTTVRLTILETTEPGNPALDYTPISEVEIL